MHHHFDGGLKVRKLVQEYCPAWVLEMGAGSGNNTRQYVDLVEDGLLKTVVVINDGPQPSGWESAGVLGHLIWLNGISYMVLPSFADSTIPFASIDTDHNGWTLDKELNVLSHKMMRGGIVVIHDTLSFGHTNGYAMRYNTGAPYHQEILDCPLKYGEALAQHLGGGQWRKIKDSNEHNGAVALQRT